MIHTRDLTLDYGNGRGIIDITLSIPQGKIYSLVGASGCGKTTLLKVLASLIPSGSGTFLLGNDNDSACRLGFIQQEDALYPWLNVRQNTALGLDNHDPFYDRIIMQALDDVGMADDVNSYPHQLSGGQRQRVSIARTLATAPDILLMDEPTASLDALTKESLQNLLMDLHIQKPRTTLFVTHSIEEAVFLSDSVMMMHDGRIVSQHDVDLPMGMNRRNMDTYYPIIRQLKQAFTQGACHE